MREPRATPMPSRRDLLGGAAASGSPAAVGPAILRRPAHAQEPRPGRRAEGRDHRRAAVARRALDDREPHVRRHLPPLRAPLHAGRALRRRPDAGGGPRGLRRRARPGRSGSGAACPSTTGRSAPPRTWSRRSRGGAGSPAWGRRCSRTSSPSRPRTATPSSSGSAAAPGAVLAALGNASQFPAIYPKEVVDAAGDGQIKDFIGTGPFRFVERIPDRYTRMARFDRYAARPEAADRLRRAGARPTWTSSSSSRCRTCRCGPRASSRASSTSATGSPPTTSSA